MYNGWDIVTASLDKLLTTTMELQRPDGSGGFASIGTYACTPPDPLSGSVAQSYPIGKPFQTRQVFTQCDDAIPGDYVEIGSTLYAVQGIMPWDTLGGMDAYVQLILEELISA